MPSDDQSRNSVMFAIIAFNVTVILLMVLFMVIRGGLILGFWDFVIAFVVASLAALGSYGLGSKIS